MAFILSFCQCIIASVESPGCLEVRPEVSVDLIGVLGCVRQTYVSLCLIEEISDEGEISFHVFTLEYLILGEFQPVLSDV